MLEPDVVHEGTQMKLLRPRHGWETIVREQSQILYLGKGDNKTTKRPCSDGVTTAGNPALPRENYDKMLTAEHEHQNFVPTYNSSEPHSEKKKEKTQRGTG